MRLAKTTFELTVLHLADQPVMNLSLDQVQYEITDGDCLGMTKFVRTESIPPAKAHDAMLEIGNDGTFFEGRGEDEAEESEDADGGHEDPAQDANANYPKTGYGKVEWSVGDVTCLVNVTDEQAAAWLDRNHKQIQERMVEAGWDAIHALLAMDNPAAPGAKQASS